MYVNTGGTSNIGQLQKIIVFENNATRQAFVVVSCLENSSEKLCNDSVTHAKLNDHILSLKIPRYS